MAIISSFLDVLNHVTRQSAPMSLLCIRQSPLSGGGGTGVLNKDIRGRWNEKA